MNNHVTVLEIDVNALEHNLHYFKKKLHEKTTYKKQLFSYFFRLRALQKSSSRVGGVTISENDLKKSCFFRCHFWSRFLLKNEVCSTYSNMSNHQKTLFFEMKTKHFHVLSKNRDPKKGTKKHLKKNEKMGP